MAGYAQPPGYSSNFHVSEEPPGGTFPTARRCIEFLPNSGFLDVGPGSID